MLCPHVTGRFPRRGYTRWVSNQDPSHPSQNPGLNVFTSLRGGVGVLQGCSLCCACQGHPVELTLPEAWEKHLGKFSHCCWSALRLFVGSCAAPAVWDRQDLERKDINI